MAAEADEDGEAVRAQRPLEGPVGVEAATLLLVQEPLVVPRVAKNGAYRGQVLSLKFHCARVERVPEQLLYGLGALLSVKRSLEVLVR